jgi:hypothetical protein
VGNFLVLFCFGTSLTSLWLFFFREHLPDRDFGLDYERYTSWVVSFSFFFFVSGTSLTFLFLFLFRECHLGLDFRLGL